MTSSLRRRGELGPIIPFRELETRNETDPFLVLHVSPCKTRVSNDPLHPTSDMMGATSCNITSYDCVQERGLSGNETNTTEISTMVISYQYELWIRSGAYFNSTLETLEESMLEHTAAITGLAACATSEVVIASISRQYPTGNRRMQTFTTEQMNMFVGIQSTPTDTVDGKYDDCIVPVESSSISESICQPMVGEFTASVIADLKKEPVLEDSLRSGILRLIRQGMVNDIFIGGNVSKVSFVGTRVNAGGSSTTSDSVTVFNTGSGDKTKITSVGIAFMAVGSVLALSLLALLIRRRKRQKEKMRQDLVFVDATIATRTLDGDSDIDSQFHKRRFSSQSRAPEAAIGQGSLAAVDSLALQPQSDTKIDNYIDTSFISTETFNETLSVSPSSKSQISTPNLSPEQQSFNDSDHIIDTSSLDGANEDTILDRLHGIAEASEEPLGNFTEDDNSDVSSVRIA